jgi:hypothetical protein
MKKGKQLGEYSFKATSNRVREDDKLEINFEGTVSGFGFVINTMTVTVGDGKRGRYDLREVSYRDDGTIATASSEKGEYNSTGKFKWDTTGVIKVEGRAFIEEGTMELATKTWSGKYYEVEEP